MVSSYKRWLPVLAIAIMAALVALWGGAGVDVANAQPTYNCVTGADCIAIDADIGTAGIQTTITKAVGESFTVRAVVVEESHAGYQGYSIKMGVNQALVKIVDLADWNEDGTPAGAPGTGNCKDGIENDSPADGIDLADPQCAAAVPLYANGNGQICVSPATTCLPAGPVISNVADGLGDATLFGGEGRLGGVTSYEGDVYNIGLICKAAGTATLDLRPPPADPLGQSTTLNPGASHTPTNTNDAQVVCQQQADIQVTKVDSPDPIVAGGALTYTVVVKNAGPNPANGVLLGDLLPSDKLFVSAVLMYDADGPGGDDPAALDCDPGWVLQMPHPEDPDLILHNVVFCSLAAVGVYQMPAGAVATLTIVVEPSLLSAGKLDVNIAQAASLGVPQMLPPTVDPHGTKAEGGWEVTAANGQPLNTPGDADCADVETLFAMIQHDPLDPTLKNLGCEITAIAPADVTITKDDNGGDGDYTTPESITWEVTVAVGAGSAASGVSIHDQVDVATQDSITGATITPAGICTNNITDGSPVIAYPDVDCVLAVDDDGDTLYDEDPPGDFDGDTVIDDDGDGDIDEDDAEVNIAAGGSVVMTVTSTVDVSETTNCLNDADVTFADPATVTTQGSVICRPPDAELAKVPDMVNIWLCVDQATDGLDNDGSTTPDDEGEVATCLNPGEGSLDISEMGRNINDLDSPNDDDDGDGQPVSQEWFDSLPPYLQTPELAAQIDHEGDEVGEGLGAYEFQLKFDHKIFDISVEDSGYLGVSGRTVICEMTIVTENDIRWACASIGAPGLPGPSGAGPVLIATVHVTPEPDLYQRLRPSKDNGVIRVLDDENCEFADTLGDPMGGTLPGGLLKTCGDAVVTVRMLEGDLNLDCEVGLVDEQMIAYRYGSFFGSLWYQPWFDLEPPLTDFDVDIKDVQFVFGRDGSTCGDPYPGQDPAPFPPGY